MPSDQPGFVATQFEFANYLRDPDHAPPPRDIEDRRLAIYRDLVYNNIENFIAAGFPVLRSILDDCHWHELVRDFIRDHRCHSPYFLDIGKEFLAYLQESRVSASWEPPFLVELCHYEWVELALDIAVQDIPPNEGTETDPLKMKFQVSPLVWRLSYSYPVHTISENNQPSAPSEYGVFLIVYRNREDKVRFLEVNQITIRLLQEIDNKDNSGEDMLQNLCIDLGFSDESGFINHGCATLAQLLALDVLVQRN